MIPLQIISMYYTNANTKLYVELAYYELDKRITLTFFVPSSNKYVVIKYNLQTAQYTVIHVDEDKLEEQLNKLKTEIENNKEDSIIILTKKEKIMPYFKTFYLVKP
ncbi:MAG: hypothetical protein F9Y92_06350 [Thermoplasmatales archaeon]|nr:hypothetical protein [Thermoplasmatales archaeon]